MMQSTSTITWPVSMALLGSLACTLAGAQSTAPAAVPKNPEVEKLAEQYARKFRDAPQVTVDQTLALLAESRALLIDVRSPAERAVSRIPGAIRLDEFDPRDAHGRVVVPYCTIGYRSSQTTIQLRKQGIDARNLRGGILAWVNGLQPLENPRGEPTRSVHTYGSQWSIVPPGYQAVR